MPEMNLSTAKLYGKGIFTTVAFANGVPILWEKHWRRLLENGRSLDIDLSDRLQEETLAALRDEIEKSGIHQGRARITLSDESSSRIWTSSEEIKTSLSIIVAERRAIPDEFKLAISPHRISTTSPLVGIKSCNYLEHLLAYEEVTRRGFHEAIRLNERGEVASACMSNVFWEKDGKLFTPDLKTGCLPGTTREFILENVRCKEVIAGIQQFENADRIFLTSAGIGVVSAHAYEGRKLDSSDHVLSRLLPF